MTVHDLRRRGWGHNVEFLRRRDDGSWRVVLWLGERVRLGDHVVVRGRADGTWGDLRYLVIGDVKWQVNPGDMCFASLIYDPPQEGSDA